MNPSFWTFTLITPYEGYLVAAFLLLAILLFLFGITSFPQPHARVNLLGEKARPNSKRPLA